MNLFGVVINEKNITKEKHFESIKITDYINEAETIRTEQVLFGCQFKSRNVYMPIILSQLQIIIKYTGCESVRVSQCFQTDCVIEIFF